MANLLLRNLPLFIGLRYLRSKRRSGFVSFVSGFSFGAMALGVMALIVVLSVMNGLGGESYSRILKVIPHIVLESTEGNSLKRDQLLEQKLLADPSVEAVAPYVSGYAMLRMLNRTEGVRVQGIDPAAERGVSNVADSMILGEFESLTPGKFGVILGRRTARILGVVVGDRVRMTLPQVSRTPMGIFPREKNVKVVGIFEVGDQLDGGLAFMHMADAQRLYRRGKKIDGVRTRLIEPMDAEHVLRRLQHNVPLLQSEGVRLQSWGDQLGSLYVAMRMEKIVVGLLLAIVIAVAAFNIVANLVLMVSEKRKDIAVLRSMGASAATVVKVFVAQGTASGLFGVLFGGLIGCLLGVSVGDMIAWLEHQLNFTVLDPDVYYTTTLPSILLWSDVLMVCGGAALMSFMATIYPAWRASRIQPAEALRYDH